MITSLLFVWWQVRWCQFSPAVVVVVVTVAGFCTAQNSASREDSNESFHPSPLIIESPFSFRPRPRGGRLYDSTGLSFSSSSSPSPSAFRSPNSFSSPSSSSSETFSSYSSLQSPSASSSFSSPSFSSFSSNVSPSPSQFSSPSFSIVQATGVKLHDTSSSHDSRESFGLPHSPSLGYSAPGISPTLNSHGSTGLISSPQQSYGAPPRVSPAPSYNPTPAPIQDYGPPPPRPTPGPSYIPPSTSHHNHGSRERLDSLEVPDNIFGDSIESFLNAPPHDISPSGTSSFLNSQPTRGFSSPPDRSTSHETFLRPATFSSQPLDFSNPPGRPDPHEIIHRPTALNPPSGFSLPSSDLRSAEIFHSLESHRPSSQRFPSSSSDHLASSSTFHGPGVGSLSLHDSSETSSELFLRTSGQPRPNFAPQVSASQPQTSFVGAFPNYYFNYNVHDPEEDDFDSLGRGNKGPNFGHSERREGGRTEGRYYVELPDGRTQVVEYYADETGYHPTITYI
ncbi:uncharacterized protein LOC135103973 [Scylla paramamosain]|uniref:uncharacterized protein LOC135103973 n=1 Tax=Scylla paramamosain TaxID=85552 RepID=UPI003083691F